MRKIYIKSRSNCLISSLFIKWRLRNILKCDLIFYKLHFYLVIKFPDCYLEVMWLDVYRPYLRRFRYLYPKLYFLFCAIPYHGVVTVTKRRYKNGNKC